MKWVNIKKKKPEPDGEVYLVCTRGGTHLMLGFYDPEGYFYDPQLGKFEGVTHWMVIEVPKC